MDDKTNNPNLKKETISSDDINKALGKMFTTFVKAIYESKVLETQEITKNIDTIKKEFKELILRLSKTTKDFNIELFIDELNKYLCDNKRLLYSEFTSIIIDHNKSGENDQTVGIIISNLESCIDYSMNEENKISENIQKTLIKLWDHANLASNQYNYFMTTDDMFISKVKPIIDPEVEKLKSQYEGLHKEVEESQKQLEVSNNEVKDIKSKIISDVIALISIFVAIAFVMFGGMSLLNGLFDFSNMQYVPMTEIIGLGALMGIIIVAIIYTFMFFVLKIIGRDEHGKCLPNFIIGIVIIVLVGFCFMTYCNWQSNPSDNIYKNKIDYNQQVNQTENNNQEENIKTDKSSEIFNQKENINQ